MKTDELRDKYLDFFKTKGHTVCASDVMVPKWDKTVLFTPGGKNANGVEVDQEVIPESRRASWVSPSAPHLS